MATSFRNSSFKSLQLLYGLSRKLTLLLSDDSLVSLKENLFRPSGNRGRIKLFCESHSHFASWLSCLRCRCLEKMKYSIPLVIEAVRSNTNWWSVSGVCGIGLGRGSRTGDSLSEHDSAPTPSSRVCVANIFKSSSLFLRVWCISSLINSSFFKVLAYCSFANDIPSWIFSTLSFCC